MKGLLAIVELVNKIWDLVVLLLEKFRLKKIDDQKTKAQEAVLSQKPEDTEGERREKLKDTLSGL